MCSQEEHQTSKARHHAELLAKQLTRCQARSQSLLLNWKVPGARKHIEDAAAGSSHAEVNSTTVAVGPVPLHGTYTMYLEVHFGQEGEGFSKEHLGLYFRHSSGGAHFPINIAGSFITAKRPEGAVGGDTTLTISPGSAIRKAGVGLGWRTFMRTFMTLGDAAGFCHADGSLHLQARIMIAHPESMDLAVAP